MQAANQHALKSIKKSAEQSALRTGSKELSIMEGNLVLLWDHPKGHNKIQDHFKDQELAVVKQLYKPNVYQIKPVSGVSPEWVMSCKTCKKPMVLAITPVIKKWAIYPPSTLKWS